MTEPIPIAEYERSRTRGIPADRDFRFTGTNEILSTEFPPIMWVVPDYLPEGFSVLAGRQKLGKTWLAMDFALAVACGGYALGSIDCEVGDVLYCDLENGLRRIKRRLGTIMSPEARPEFDRLKWCSEAPALNAGFLDLADSWRKSVPNARLLVIDVLQRIKPPPSSKRQNAYESDYSIFAGLQSWAQKNRIAVLGLHHTRKGGADDPLEALTGSNGLSAVADTTLVLDRDQNGTTLYVRGRDVEERETALQFTGGLWSMLGEAGEVFRSQQRVTLAVTLEAANEPMTPQDVADATGMKPGNVRKLLFSMAKAGEVLRAGYGKYVHPRNTHLAEDSGNTGHTGNAQEAE